MKKSNKLLLIGVGAIVTAPYWTVVLEGLMILQVVFGLAMIMVAANLIVNDK